MKKVIRMTETDLTRLVKRVIQEQKSVIYEGDGSRTSPFLDHEIQPDVDTIVDDLDGWVDGSNLESIYSIIMKYNNKFASDYTNPNRPVTVLALKRLADLYRMDENGDDLLRDLQQVGTLTLSNPSITKKNQAINVLRDALKNTAKPAVTKKPSQPSNQSISGSTTSTGGGSPRPTNPTSRMPVS